MNIDAPPHPLPNLPNIIWMIVVWLAGWLDRWMDDWVDSWMYGSRGKPIIPGYWVLVWILGWNSGTDFGTGIWEGVGATTDVGLRRMRIDCVRVAINND